MFRTVNGLCQLPPRCQDSSPPCPACERHAAAAVLAGGRDVACRHVGTEGGAHAGVRCQGGQCQKGRYRHGRK